MSKYSKRGVSSKKEVVHNAIENIDPGLFPSAFCKINEDILGGDDKYCNIMHSDGAGTKASLAYIYYKETQDLSVFEGIAMDSFVMNIDDLLCVGATGPFLVSSIIDRNSHLIDGQIISKLINSNETIIEKFNGLGIKLVSSGGETADVGDIVKTLVVNTIMTARMKRDDVITNQKIKPDMVIIGLSSSGKAVYEDEYNSGISSNGLTSARHDVLSSYYAEKYPETYDHLTPQEIIYCGSYKLDSTHKELPITIGKALLSPTRTFAPILKEIFLSYREKIGGIVHCTGGGLTKSIKFGNNIHYVKNNLFDIPPIFKIIKEESGVSYREMYEVYNMGHRIEIMTDEATAKDIIDISTSFKVEAKIIGYTDYSDTNKISITSPKGIIEYQ